MWLGEVVMFKIVFFHENKIPFYLKQTTIQSEISPRKFLSLFQYSAKKTGFSVTMFSTIREPYFAFAENNRCRFNPPPPHHAAVKNSIFNCNKLCSKLWIAHFQLYMMSSLCRESFTSVATPPSQRTDEFSERSCPHTTGRIFRIS